MDKTMEANTFEDETSDQPVDYSKKYTEQPGVLRNNPENMERAAKKELREHNSKVIAKDLFGDYAETDLDQPTDYSLRYAEDDTDDDEKEGPEYFPGSLQEDTVKTYCTEGTPYETPFNFSTATSMSDLRVEESSKEDVVKKIQKKEHEIKDPGTFKSVLRCDVQQSCKDLERKSIMNPGQVTPEKISYYGEGTPNEFSRANSLSSLNSVQNSVQSSTRKPGNETIGKEVERNDDTSRLSSENDSEGKSNTRVIDKEGKMVTFGGQDYYAEQTPLMFSRCSSLGSLSGFEQHSIHDDRSSVVSDFSRRTSGVVSPSELPDSPTQTVPPSPRTHKSQASSEFLTKIQEEAEHVSLSDSEIKRATSSDWENYLDCFVWLSVYPKTQVTRSSVFEDDIATFKEESTPIEFSTATSLSSLTIDDEPKTESSPGDPLQEAPASVEKEPEKNPAKKDQEEKEQEQVSDGDEDDEDMLAACISMGMQNNRYRQSFKTTVQKVPSPPVLRYPRNPINRLEPRLPGNSANEASSPAKTKTAIEAVVVPDTVHVYCTEDTPADISPVGSQSNLSALSMPSVQEDLEKIEEKSEVECLQNDLSDESSNLSGEDEKILDECIQSGMPKVRQITPPPASCIPFVKKTETLSQKFSVCGTPSSSPVEASNKAPILTKPMLCRLPIGHENEISDDSPNHSEDEAILTECIQAAIPKISGNTRLNASLNPPPLPRSSPSKSEKPQPSTLQNPVHHSSYPSTYTDPKKPAKKPVSFEDNLSLSEEEEDIILAQCIRSGMPKALNVSSPVPLPKKPEQKPMTLPGSSSSYLNSKPHPARTAPQISQIQQATPSYKHVATDVSDLLATSCSFNRLSLKDPPKNGAFEKLNVSRRRAEERSEFASSRISSRRSPVFPENDEEKSNAVPSRHSSVSSLSEEGSLGSIEEWALLDFCISCGTPRNKFRMKGLKNERISGAQEDPCDPLPEDNYSVCSYNSYVCKT